MSFPPGFQLPGSVRIHHRRSGWILISGLLALLGLASCSRSAESTEEARVKLAFESCKSALINHQTAQVMTYVPHDVYVYLNQLKTTGKVSSLPANLKSAGANDSPNVTLLLRTALEKKVPADLRPTLTLDSLMQRISDKRLLDLRHVQEITLGPISVTGSRASAELYYQGRLTAVRLPFLKEGHDWKIDVLAILPYAEVLMRLDRAMTGLTETQQVNQIVNKLPSL